MGKLNMPDITLAQALAAFTWIVGQLTIMGVADQQTTKTVLSVGLTVIAAAWKVADSIIRSGRAKIAAAEVVAGTVGAPLGTTTTPVTTP